MNFRWMVPLNHDVTLNISGLHSRQTIEGSDYI